MKYFLIFLVLFAIGCGDTNASPKPENIQPPTGKLNSWDKQYQIAMNKVGTDLKQSCKVFDRLQTDRTIRISNLMKLRYLQYCANKTTAINQLKKLLSSSDKTWLKKLAVEFMMNHALKLNRSDIIINYTSEHLTSLASQKEKENLLDKAIGAARRTGNSTKLREFQKLLYKTSPRLRPNPSSNQWLKVANDFRSNTQWSQALNYYDKIIRGRGFSIEDNFGAKDGVRKLHKRKFRFYQGPLHKFIDASKQTSEFCQRTLDRNPSGLPAKLEIKIIKCRLQYARDHWSYDDVNVTYSELTNFLNQANIKNKYRAYAYWILARVYANYKLWNESSQAAKLAFDFLLPNVGNIKNWPKWQKELWDDASWATALALRKIKQYTKSNAVLKLARQHTQSFANKNKFLFWRAQNFSAMNLNSDAKRSFQRVYNEDPFGFYGFVSANEADLNLTKLTPIDLSQISRPSSVTLDSFKVLKQLVLVQDFDLAPAFVRKLVTTRSFERNILLLRAFAHDFTGLWSLYGLLATAQKKIQFTKKYASLLYPKPFRNTVTKALKKVRHVEQAYVYSIMRQESAFNPKARSWANAYGLLQLLPKIARESQQKAGVYFTHDYELFVPEINIPLGVAHMDDHAIKTGDRFIIKTAAYNASYEKVKDWKDRLYTGDVFEFMEEIPYSETRLYVRLVMRNYLMNLRLNSTKDIQFPKRLLDIR